LGEKQLITKCARSLLSMTCDRSSCLLEKWEINWARLSTQSERG